MLSVIVPVYNEEESILPLYEELQAALGKNDEVLFVDDGSRDSTAERVKKLIAGDSRVRLVRFQRNFGKAAALAAGFERARGDVVITMDGDLQDDPLEIPRFLEAITEHDMVSGWKIHRQDPLGKRLPSKFFNWLTALVTGLRIHDFNCGFKAYRKEVVRHLNLYGELHRYIPALAHWEGFSVGEIPVNHHPRRFGRSKYGIERLTKGFFDLLTVKFLMTYAKRPLHFFGWIGAAFSALGGLAGLWVVYLKLLGEAVGNRPILVLSVLLIVVGIQFFSLGLLGEIVSSHSGPRYVVREDTARML